MKISVAWLQKYFDSPLPKPEELAHALTFHAFELESVEQSGEDTVLDVKVTPNRGHDALSHRGIAKELSVILGIPLASDPLSGEFALTPVSKKISITIENPELCHGYTAAFIEGVKVGPSPDWLKKRLETIGQRSINNVVDAMNFVMFNIGQPLHAFDADKLEGEKKSIFVRLPLPGEGIETLDGALRALPQTALLIADGADGTPLGIAGIKGGKVAEIDADTENIIIESATFAGTAIRKTAQALRLRTDASARFEHELAPALAPYALQAAVELVLKVAGGKLEGYADAFPKPIPQSEVSITLEHLNGMLGLSLSGRDVEDILKRFGFEYRTEGNTFTVRPPKERLDLIIPEDLIEEIGRIYSYDHVPTVVPEKKRADVLNKRFFYTDKIREILLEEGFSEVFTSSFRSHGEVAMENALASDKDHLRADLRANLEEALVRNSRNQDLLGLDCVKIFEVGTVFTERGEHVALALGIRFAEAKLQKKADEEIKAALGKIEAEFDVPVPAEAAQGIIEANLDALIAALPEVRAYEERPATPKVRYESFSSYPFVLRDIALWTPGGTEAKSVEDILKKEGGALLVRTRLFDRFEKDGRISYAFRLVFQATDRTLTDEEVNGVMEKVSKTLAGEGGFEVR